jgi:hypothetical protein
VWVERGKEKNSISPIGGKNTQAYPVVTMLAELFQIK